MTKYWVTMPFAGSVSVLVEADNATDAMSAAFDASLNLRPDDIQYEGILAVEVNEWEMMMQITRGNVCYAPVHEARAEEADE